VAKWYNITNQLKEINMTVDEILKAIDRDITIAKSNFDACGGGDAELYWAGREDALNIIKAKIEHLKED
jgi:hypothetical protein